MQASRTHAAETAARLNELGIELSAGGLLVMTDFAKAESAYIHHSRVPVAVVAMAVASPTFARGRFPKLRLVDVVAKAPSMDGIEQCALARVCGANIDDLPEGSGRAPAFAAHLVEVIARHELDAFFTRVPDRAVNNIDVRPRGYNWRTEQVDIDEMRDWRRRYKALPPVRQMMVATILWLYRGGADKIWLAARPGRAYRLRRATQPLPSTWLAADAVAALQSAGRGAARLGPTGRHVSGVVTMPKAKQDDQVLRIIAQLNGLFVRDDVSPADQDRWQELKRHIIRMRSSLGLVVTSISKMRELGIPMTDDEARKIEGYARFGLGEKKDWTGGKQHGRATEGIRARPRRAAVSVHRR